MTWFTELLPISEALTAASVDVASIDHVLATA
jgi:hypothetical protein